jgi:2-polyprenyl-3-methyl-5-hydroxy-6-metoxy-1,4-benzoquinol methylase
MNEPTNQDNIQAWSNFSRDMIDAFGDEGDPSHRYLLNPAIFELVGNVANRTILEAGCGTGYLCRIFARQGAQVTGIEPASSFFEYATEREQAAPLGIRYLQQDLSTCTLSQAAFDIVVANMVFMDIPDYQPAMRNCIRALKTGGRLVFSLLHPCFDEMDKPDFEKGYATKGYIRIDEYLHEFSVQQKFGHYIHRPLSEYMNLVIDEGCAIGKVIEPTLTDEGLAVLGENNRNVHIPNFIVISASKTRKPSHSTTFRTTE